MYSFLRKALLLGAAATVAFSAAESQCSFDLTASGGRTGTLGQLADGQIRIGGSLSPSVFTIIDGAIYDPSGFGCLLTNVGQFQCDYGKAPITGFSIGSDASLQFYGNSVFYACPSTVYDWNVYTTPVPNQDFCSQILLTANNCASS